jgi:hypothetical protein
MALMVQSATSRHSSAQPREGAQRAPQPAPVCVPEPVEAQPAQIASARGGREQRANSVADSACGVLRVLCPLSLPRAQREPLQVHTLCCTCFHYGGAHSSVACVPGQTGPVATVAASDVARGGSPQAGRQARELAAEVLPRAVVGAR